jgi:hypothetical protein
MRRLVAATWAGLLFAAAAGILFWGINSIYQVNGVGILRQQEGPINSPWVWVAVAFVGGAVAQVILSPLQGGHDRRTRELAQELGREYTESYSLPPAAGAMPLFEGWLGGRNAMTSRADESPVTVFDYTIFIRGDSDTERAGTVALLPVDGLPAFDLRPRTFGRRLLGWTGFEGLTFDPEAINPIAAEAVRRFTDLFQLSVLDPVALLGALAGSGPPVPAGAEEAVRRLFTPAVMAMVSQYPAYALQSRPGFLAVWRGSGVLPARSRTELWHAAMGLRALLTRPPRDEAVPVVPGRAGTEGSRQARKLRNTMGGGAIGMFVGFILGSMATSILFFRQVPGQGPGVTFFMLPLLFFGSIVLGSAVGSGIGSRLPVRDVPPEAAESPERRARRLRAARRGVVLGLFGGFFGGSVLFSASKILLGWKLDFGVESAMMCGSSFGGALLGAVICGTLVNRLYRRRQSGSSSP